MPNRCNNNFSASTTTEAEVEKLVDKLLNEDWVFSFECLLPPPSGLSQCYPVKIVTEDSDPNKWSLTQEQSDTLIQKYWYDNRYEWNNANWWCKRDACETNVDQQSKDIYINFNTPRWPPNQWFAKLCETFPNITFSMYYEEPWCAFEWDIYSDWEWWYTDDERSYVPFCESCCDKLDDVVRREDREESLCDECCIPIYSGYDEWITPDSSVTEEFYDQQMSIVPPKNYFISDEIELFQVWEPDSAVKWSFTYSTFYKKNRERYRAWYLTESDFNSLCIK